MTYTDAQVHKMFFNAAIYTVCIAVAYHFGGWQSAVAAAAARVSLTVVPR